MAAFRARSPAWGFVNCSRSKRSAGTKLCWSLIDYLQVRLRIDTHIAIPVLCPQWTPTLAKPPPTNSSVPVTFPAYQSPGIPGSGTVCGDERLPKGPRFASESLDADTANGPVFSNWPTTEFQLRNATIPQAGIIMQPQWRRR